MYTLLKHLHSGMRWVMLIGLIWAIYDAYVQWKKGTAFTKETRLPSFLAFNFTHIQLLLGLIIYFISPRVLLVSGMMKDSVMRFFGMEHPLMMLIAISLITVGYIKGKKGVPGGSFKTIF